MTTQPEPLECTLIILERIDCAPEDDCRIDHVAEQVRLLHSRIEELEANEERSLLILEGNRNTIEDLNSRIEKLKAQLKQIDAMYVQADNDREDLEEQLEAMHKMYSNLKGVCDSLQKQLDEKGLV